MTNEQAINELKDWKTAFSHMAHMDKDMSYAIEALSMAIEAISAQPEPSWDCEKCMMEHTDEMEKLEVELAIAKSKQPEPCEDAISRQAAIDEIEERKYANGYRNVAVISELNRLEGYIMRLPSVQPERKKGEWIYGEHDIAMCDGYRCDQCGFFVPWDYNHKFIDFIKDYHWCPSCGSEMRGENDEND